MSAGSWTVEDLNKNVGIKYIHFIISAFLAKNIILLASGEINIVFDKVLKIRKKKN